MTLVVPRSTELGVDGFPAWATIVTTASLVVGACCAGWILFDVVRRPQQMAVMNVVWPVTALFGGLLWLPFYGRRGRTGSGKRSFRASIAVGTTHCGAGCAIGDVVGEFGLVLVPPLAGWVGLGSLYSERTFSGWIVDLVVAFLAGIAFQYFAIAPMRHLGLRDGLIAALKADTASILAWQVGMYGGMAVAQLWLLPAWFGGKAAVTTPEFWTVMQIAMLCGFVTAYPVNRLLVRRGVKEAM